MTTREKKATHRWSRLFELRVQMESGFTLTPYNQHLKPEVRMRRWVGTQSKHFQIRYAEVNRKLAQAEAIMDEEAAATEWLNTMLPLPDYDAIPDITEFYEERI